MRFLTLFFLKNSIRSKRVLWMCILGLVPVAVAFIFLVVPPIVGKQIDPSGFFREIAFSLYLHILLPLYAALVGAGIIADEVDDRTLSYLLTRPIPKWRFVVSKTIASCITVGIMLVVSLFVTYSLLNAKGGAGGWLADMRMFLQVAVVLVLGVLVYVPLFGVLGASIRKPVLVGLLFAFGWENFMSYMPTRIRLFTVMTYLHNLFPRTGGTITEEGVNEIFKYLDASVKLTNPVSVGVLLAMFLAFTTLTVALLYAKEYRLEQG